MPTAPPTPRGGRYFRRREVRLGEDRVHTRITKSALYHHFTSKEELLALALDTALSALGAVLEEPHANEGAPSERLAFVIRRAVEVLIDHLPQVTLLLRVRGNSATELDALRRRRHFDQRVTELVGDAQIDGAVRSDIDARTATRLVFGMMNSIVEWYRPDGAIDREQVAHDILAIALDGLRASRAD